MATERAATVAMLKPDGVTRPEVGRAVLGGLAARRLAVTHRAELTLTGADVVELFPAFAQCPVTLALLAAYLTSGPVHMFVVTGECPVGQVIDGTRAVRREVRARYARSSFENCVHVAAGRTEAALQLRWLAARTGWPLRLPLVARAAPVAIPGVRGALARLGEPALRDMATAIWRTAQATGWAGHWPEPSGDGAWRVVVVSEQVNSIDSAASCLLEAVPGLTARSAIDAALEIDRAGKATAYVGDADNARSVANELTRLGLLVRLVAAPGGVREDG